MVFNSVSSTPQWIRQPEPRDMPDVLCFCVNACICALKSRGLLTPGLLCTCPFYLAFGHFDALARPLTRQIIYSEAISKSDMQWSEDEARERSVFVIEH